MEHRQKDWQERLALAEFTINNKTHTATKMSPFMANYGKEMRMGGDIRRKGRVESATEFVQRIKKVQEEAEAALKKTQEDMKRYADRGRKETVTNFIQLISPQPVDRFSQTKLLWKAPNEGYLHICRMYKSNNE